MFIRIHEGLSTFLLLTFFLAGCVGNRSAPPPAKESGINPSPTGLEVAQRPPATSAVFELKPTFTPIENAAVPASLETDGYGPENFPEGVNPLTGLKIENPANLERRPMVIKVTNFPRQVRPQWGLSKADHIYEYYLEDGMTRFVGIYYGTDAERVGPVRSARPFDEHLVRMYKGIFAFGYADRKVYDYFVESDLAPYLVLKRSDNCPPMCRIGPDWDYNTLYTNTTDLSQYITDKGFENGRQDLNGLHFKEFYAIGGGEANFVYIRFSLTSHHMWQYDPTNMVYLRSQEAESRDLGSEIYEPLFDSLTGKQISADNLILLLVPSGKFFESNSTDIYTFNLVGEGNAYALRDGRIFKVHWSRPTMASMISLKYPNGIHYPLKPGNVWFEVLTETTNHEVEPLGGWRFIFDLGLE